MDWDIGAYEFIAPQLIPVSDLVVSRCDLQRGETALDLGCGTGNAALRLAASGAHVVGVDPSPRLLALAVAAAAAAKFDIQFLAGRAEEIPLDSASVHATVSVFALIFCNDPATAAREIARVLAPRGRLLFTAWLPNSVMSDVRREIITPALEDPTTVTMFPWHDLAAVTALFEPSGFTVTSDHHTVDFTGSTVRDFVREEWEHVPAWVTARQRLEQLGRFDDVNERVIARLEVANESATAFSVASPYVLYTLRRTGLAFAAA